MGSRIQKQARFRGRCGTCACAPRVCAVMLRQDSDTDQYRPCYENVMNNIASPLVEISNHAWPVGTPNFINHGVISQYIIDAARVSGLDQHTRFDTRVEQIWKENGKWKVLCRKMHQSKSSRAYFARSTDVSFMKGYFASANVHSRSLMP